MAEDWDKLDAIEKELRERRQNVKDLKESKGVFTELINDAEEAMDVWDKLKEQLEDGETVYDPSKKRKRSAEPKQSRKKAKKAKKSRSRFVDSSTPWLASDKPSSTLLSLGLNLICYPH